MLETFSPERFHLLAAARLCRFQSDVLSKRRDKTIKKPQKLLINWSLWTVGSFSAHVHSCVIVHLQILDGKMSLTFNLASLSHAKNLLLSHAAFTDSRKSEGVEKRLQQIRKISHKRKSSQNEFRLCFFTLIQM